MNERKASEELKTAFRKATARRAAYRGACPAGETFASAASGTLAGAERERFVEHLCACAECAEEMRLLAPLSEWAGVEAEPRARILRFPKTAAYRVAALAAALVLAVGTAILVSRPHPAPPVERGLLPETWNVTPKDGALLASPPARLAWPADESATSYRVVLLDFESTPIWESPALSTPAATIPDDVQKRLVKGRPTYWRVTVVSEVERRPSALFRFEIAP